jgi:hypothetical protein
VAVFRFLGRHYVTQWTFLELGSRGSKPLATVKCRYATGKQATVKCRYATGKQETTPRVARVCARDGHAPNKDFLTLLRFLGPGVF